MKVPPAFQNYASQQKPFKNGPPPHQIEEDIGEDKKKSRANEKSKNLKKGEGPAVKVDISQKAKELASVAKNLTTWALIFIFSFTSILTPSHRVLAEDRVR